MKKSYSLALANLEKSKEDLIHLIAKNDHQYISSRKNGKWSPLEQCYHLHMAEMLSRKYCEKKLSFNPELKDAGYKNSLRLWLLQLIEYLPLKFKAPTAVGQQSFPENLNLDMVTMEWSHQREQLGRFLENLDPSYVDKEIYKQPMVGRLTIGGMLKFFQFHIDRHRSHIKRDYGIG